MDHESGERVRETFIFSDSQMGNGTESAVLQDGKAHIGAADIREHDVV
jgi:hypothetical protein